MGRTRIPGMTWNIVHAALFSAAICLPYVSNVHAKVDLFPHIFQEEMYVEDQGIHKVALSARLKREVRCLALNVYFEARGEPLKGRYAVAAVTLNRVASPDFPNTICQVVLQGMEYGRDRCQFSWVCDGRSDHPSDAKAWRSARNVALNTLFRKPPDPTKGALYFHATRVRPAWSRVMVRVVRIGRHIYYRQPTTVAQDNHAPPS